MSPPAIATSNSIEILTVIDCRGADERADETIESIRSAGGTSRIVTLGGRERRDIVRCDRPSDLASLGRVEGVWICPMFAGDRLAAGCV